MPVEQPVTRVQSIGTRIKAHVENYRGRDKSVTWTRERSAPLVRHLGNLMVADLNEDKIRDYIATREAELKKIRKKRGDDTTSGRTINMEVGLLARVLGHKREILWPNIKPLEEREDIGRCLSPEEEAKLLAAAQSKKTQSPTIYAFVRILLLTAMRSGELKSLTWGQINFEKRTIRVGRAKTSSGTGRLIPMNDELFEVIVDHGRWHADVYGEAEPQWFLFPERIRPGKPADPTKPTSTLKTAWGALQRRSGVECRLHDLRHTAITKLAESGQPDHVIMSIVGHLSRKMIEHYSHIRLEAKRKAVAVLSTAKPILVPAKVPASGKLRMASHA